MELQGGDEERKSLANHIRCVHDEHIEEARRERGRQKVQGGK